MSGRPERVEPTAARQAAIQCGGDYQATYSRYILLRRAVTGSLACGCDNRDLQAWYRLHPEGLPAPVKKR